MRVLRHIGLALYSGLWYAWNLFFIRQYFEARGLRNWRPELFHLWKPNAQYFSGFRGSSRERVYIKFGRKHLIKREVEAIRSLSGFCNHNAWLPVVVEYDLDWKIPNISFRYLEGESLNKMLKRGEPFARSTIEQVTRILEEIVCVLHGRGLVHRDIRPHNIIVGPQGEVYLLDYAYAVDTRGENAALQELAASSRNRSSLLRLGHGFNPRPGAWDDAYSCIKILSELGGEGADVSKLSEYVGKLTWQMPRG